MHFIFRISALEDFVAFQQSFKGSGHLIDYDAPGEKIAKSDAEFMSLGLAESFGSTPPLRNNSAYVLPVRTAPINKFSYIITGITLRRSLPPKEELLIIFRAILKCVGVYNRKQRHRLIASVGVSDMYLYNDKLSSEEIRNIVTEAELDFDN